MIRFDLSAADGENFYVTQCDSDAIFIHVSMNGGEMEIRPTDARWFAQALLVAADRHDEAEGTTPEAEAARLGITVEEVIRRELAADDYVKQRYPDLILPVYGAGSCDHRRDGS